MTGQPDGQESVPAFIPNSRNRQFQETEGWIVQERLPVCSTYAYGSYAVVQLHIRRRWFCKSSFPYGVWRYHELDEHRHYLRFSCMHRRKTLTARAEAGQHVLTDRE